MGEVGVAGSHRDTVTETAEADGFDEDTTKAVSGPKNLSIVNSKAWVILSLTNRKPFLLFFKVYVYTPVLV